MKNNKDDFYVYCLIDPNNNEPFYVGKGIGSRGDNHLELKSKDYDNCSEKEFSKKLNKIQEIRTKGHKPYVRRFMWNLSEDNAFIVETALINLLPNLTNIIEGQKLTNVRKLSDFNSWEKEYPGVDIPSFNNNLDYLDANDSSKSFFYSKTHAFNAAGSSHKSAQGSYFIHSKTGIRMWTGNTQDKKWENSYDEDKGEFYIGEKALLDRHKTWAKN